MNNYQFERKMHGSGIGLSWEKETRSPVGLSRNMLMIKVFTMTELLVVITIISILACLLLPALSQAKKMATKILCVGNMKQVNYCVAQYVNDNNDYVTGYYLLNETFTYAGLTENKGKFAYYTGSQSCYNAVQEGTIYTCPAQTANPTAWSKFRYENSTMTPTPPYYFYSTYVGSTIGDGCIDLLSKPPGGVTVKYDSINCSAPGGSHNGLTDTYYVHRKLIDLLPNSVSYADITISFGSQYNKRAYGNVYLWFKNNTPVYPMDANYMSLYTHNKACNMMKLDGSVSSAPANYIKMFDTTKYTYIPLTE